MKTKKSPMKKVLTKGKTRSKSELQKPQLVWEQIQQSYGLTDPHQIQMKILWYHIQQLIKSQYQGNDTIQTLSITIDTGKCAQRKSNLKINRIMEPRAKTLIERYGFVDHDRRNSMHDEIQIWVYRNFKTIIAAVFPTLKLGPEPLDLKLEHPVVDNSQHKNFVVGFIDVYCRQMSIAMEVKTSLPGVGDVIRQIQFYKRYLSGSWIVISPDDHHSIILREQGIHFFKYKGKEGDIDQLKLFQ